MPDEEKNQQLGHDQDMVVEEQSSQENPQDEKSQETTFPEGGLKAWSVAFGAAGVLFCTFGYTNAFGYVQGKSVRLQFEVSNHD